MNKTGLWIGVLIFALFIAGGFIVLNLNKNSSSSSENATTITYGNEGTLQTSPQKDGSADLSSQQTNSGKIKEFDIIARQWEFSPEIITVSEGDAVTLRIKSIDVEHGFSLPAFGVNEDLLPGEEITVSFVADKKGAYTFFCNVYCGSGHTEMNGKLVVE